MKKGAALAGGAFILVLGAALAFYLLNGRERLNCVIFFPEPASSGLSGEPRSIHRQPTLEGNVRALAAEMVLGPMDIRHTNVFPKNTRLCAVFVDGGAAYLDFSPEMALGAKLSFEELLSAVRRTLIFNFHQLSEVIITVGGQVPGFPPYIPEKKKI